MTNIIIYTKPKTLLHKQDKLEDDPDRSDVGKYYWQFIGRDLSDKISAGDRVYFAVEKEIKGYFIIEVVDFDGESTFIEWCSSSWKDIKPISTKPFMGFKYADKVKELSEVKSGNSSHI
jgi:hypothetical protein